MSPNPSFWTSRAPVVNGYQDELVDTLQVTTNRVNYHFNKKNNS